MKIARELAIRGRFETTLIGANRCFLFLVNYARIKPEIAVKALPTLVDVCRCYHIP
jgi:hypothetical protein